VAGETAVTITPYHELMRLIEETYEPRDPRFMHPNEITETTCVILEYMGTLVTRADEPTQGRAVRVLLNAFDHQWGP
jgi:hypothetical protein